MWLIGAHRLCFASFAHAGQGSLVYYRDSYALIPEDRKEEKLTETAKKEDVLTLSEAFESLAKELPIPVELVRLPINDVPNERVPDLSDSSTSRSGERQSRCHDCRPLQLSDGKR
jgi:hypothetical protein